MKKWTQAEFDRMEMVSGMKQCGSGDFRGVNFRGMHRVSIGPDSIIGDGAELGDDCEIGARAQIGAFLRAGEGLTLGRYSRVGQRANIGAYSQIEAHCTLGEFAEIGKGAEIGDAVNMPEVCKVDGVIVDGRTMRKMWPVYGCTMHAFKRKDGAGWEIMLGGQVQDIQHAQKLGHMDVVHCAQMLTQDMRAETISMDGQTISGAHR